MRVWRLPCTGCCEQSCPKPPLSASLITPPWNSTTNAGWSCLAEVPGRWALFDDAKRRHGLGMRRRRLWRGLAGHPFVVDPHQFSETQSRIVRHRLYAPGVLRGVLSRCFGRSAEWRPGDVIRELALQRVIGVPDFHQLAADLGERQRRPAVPDRQGGHGERALDDET